MVVTRSGKNTNIYEARVHECGHMCGSTMVYCCACNDIRPKSRSHYYYCQACKATTRSHRHVYYQNGTLVEK